MKSPESKVFEFSVIAGQLKGRKIITPDLGVTRPPLSRVRKSIFDFLMPYLAEARYLDLYSGTGAYLFEAVSRGVAGATGIELEAQLATAINAQAEKFKVADRLVCRCDDVFVAIPKLHDSGTKFDLIMMAPPQYQGFVTRTLQTLKGHPVTIPESLILCQHDTSETSKINFFDFPIVQQRKYGNTTFSVLRPAP